MSDTKTAVAILIEAREDIQGDLDANKRDGDYYRINARQYDEIRDALLGQIAEVNAAIVTLNLALGTKPKKTDEELLEEVTQS